MDDAALQRVAQDAGLDIHPKALNAPERAREMAEEEIRALRDNPIGSYRQALEAWGFRWMKRPGGWRHTKSGSTMTAEEFTVSGMSVDLLREMGWVRSPDEELWSQPELRMSFRLTDLVALFAGPTGPYDFWHWVSHEVGKRAGMVRCDRCGESLGPPDRCGACGNELRQGGRCPKCSMVLLPARAATG